jgi:hypothetical protein
MITDQRIHINRISIPLISFFISCLGDKDATGYIIFTKCLKKNSTLIRWMNRLLRVKNLYDNIYCCSKPIFRVCDPIVDHPPVLDEPAKQIIPKTI